MDSRISRKAISLILPIIMMIAMATSFAFAEDTGIDYLDRWEGSNKTTTLAEGEFRNFPDNTGGTLASGTYVVDRDITLNDRLVISGVVKIILMDGKTLNSPYGVTVAGSDTLYVYGQEAETGKLVAGTRGNATSAAIGGGFGQAGGTMHFCSGTVEAKLDSSSSTGAAIGGGNGGNAGNITIHGGNITADASAGMYGAAIGGGDEGYGGTVTIWDGTVNATGAEFGAGIGSGDQPGDAPVMTVNIKGGTVTATGGDEAAGIGGGNEGNGATVNISGGTVTANGGKVSVGEGAGIGGGDEGNGGVVTISDGYVKATGGHRAAGIGGGADGSNFRTFITGGEVHAFGGGPANSGTRQSGGAGIGGGAYGHGGVIHISGGNVEAKGVWGGAGLGGGYEGSVTNIAIYGDETKVSANADKGAAAIGGGTGGDAYTISISGGEVNAEIITPAYEGISGAAIGSGYEGYAANISISGGTITARSRFGNSGAAAIGGGNKGYFGNIRIEGGTITSAWAVNGGAGIGSGSGSEKKSNQDVAKITISGGTIRSGSVVSDNYNSTGAGIGSGSSAKSPVNIEISGGTIDAYCAMDDGSDKKLYYSGAGIGSGYGSLIGTINITGGNIKATRGKGCTKADPIGYYNNEQDTPYSEIKFNYNNAQIRNEKGKGTNKRVTNTQYDSSDTNLNRIHALIDHETDWVEIKPCDHADATYEIVSPGEDGKHKIICDYCLDSSGAEQPHEFDNSNKCVCGYYRYTLTFTDGQEGGQSKETYIYPELSIYEDDGVNPNVLVRLSNYAPSFVVAGKQFDVWKTESDPTGRTYDGTESYEMKGDTTFEAQWNTISGVSIVLSSIDGLLGQVHIGNQSSNTTISDLLNNTAVAIPLARLVSEQNGYALSTELGSKPMTEVTSMTEFNDLSGSKTVDDLINATLYLPMLKEIDEVDVEVQAPVCGTTIVTTGSFPPYNQNPRPVVTAKGEGYVIDGAKRWQRYDNGSYAPASYPSGDIVIKGGYPHYVSLAVDVVYGYRFVQGTEETSVKLNDEATVVDGTKTVEPYRVLFNAQIKGVHDFGEWEEATPATCTVKGTEQRKCQATGCNETETRETDIDLDAHDYGAPTYTWATDNSSVTAEAVCSHNSEHKIKETVDTKSSVTKEATCTEKGKTKYTAVFANDAFNIQSKTVEDIDIDPDAHNWGEWKVTKPATETEEGEEKRTCSLCDKEETRPIKKLDPKPEPKPTPAPSKKVSGTLIARVTASGTNALQYKWNKVQNVAGYDIFVSKCNYKSKKYTPKKVKTIKGNNTFTWRQKKLAKKTAYKAYVKAYVYVNGKKTYVRTSPIIHAFTSGGTKRYTNPKSVKVNRTSVSIKAGKTYKIKASVIKLRKGKSLIPATHAPKLRYLSSNKKVATINSKGVIKAVGKGSCNVYVYAVNGIWKTCKVTVN